MVLTKNKIGMAIKKSVYLIIYELEIRKTGYKKYEDIEISIITLLFSSDNMSFRYQYIFLNIMIDGRFICFLKKNALYSKKKHSKNIYKKTRY